MHWSQRFVVLDVLSLSFNLDSGHIIVFFYLLQSRIQKLFQYSVILTFIVIIQL